MWSIVAGKMIETVWPGISELRTTAFRTGQFAGMPVPDRPDDRAHLQRPRRAREVQGPGAPPHAAVSRVVPGHDHPRAQRQGAQFRRPQGLLVRSLCQMGRHRCAERNVVEPSGRAPADTLQRSCTFRCPTVSESSTSRLRALKIPFKKWEDTRQNSLIKYGSEKSRRVL